MAGGGIGSGGGGGFVDDVLKVAGLGGLEIGYAAEVLVGEAHCGGVL